MREQMMPVYVNVCVCMRAKRDARIDELHANSMLH